MKLLHIDSSISGERSVSRQLTASIVERLKQATPNLEVAYRDVASTPVPQHSEALLALKFTPATTGAGDQNKVSRPHHDLAAINTVLDEFLAADIVVLGAPMYNFGIPSQLKAWIDCLAAPGKTFSYSASGPEGLCGGKRIIVASSRGGLYSPPSPMAVMDHQENYLTGFFGFIGIHNVEFVRAEGLNLGEEQRQKSLEFALAEATTLQAA
jgi:FMN-dependent NADH-azoreductase